jgi:hypothetical protein
MAGPSYGSEIHSGFRRREPPFMTSQNLRTSPMSITGESLPAGAGPSAKPSPPQTRFRIERISRSRTAEFDVEPGSTTISHGRFTVVRVPRPRCLSDTDLVVPPEPGGPVNFTLGDAGGSRLAPTPEDPLIDPFLY